MVESVITSILSNLSLLVIANYTKVGEPFPSTPSN